jgi:hypothetical protein
VAANDGKSAVLRHLVAEIQARILHVATGVMPGQRLSRSGRMSPARQNFHGRKNWISVWRADVVEYRRAAIGGDIGMGNIVLSVAKPSAG